MARLLTVLYVALDQDVSSAKSGAAVTIFWHRYSRLARSSVRTMGERCCPVGTFYFYYLNVSGVLEKRHGLMKVVTCIVHSIIPAERRSETIEML